MKIRLKEEITKNYVCIFHALLLQYVAFLGEPVLAPFQPEIVV